jgi:UDP-2,3-diacylglucosamine hydrolase
MQLPAGKKVYFLSDFHLGAPNREQSLERELLVVRFLEEARKDAAVIFIVGDVFDFWYEYKYVVPKGYTRLLGKWAEITDSGIPIHFFVGNHDMWMRDYFQTELNTPVYYEAKEFSFNDKLFHIAHGDGLGPGDHGYKALKKLFRNPVAKWCFGILPPRVGMGLADYFSRKSRGGDHAEEVFHGADNEWLITYSREQLLQKKVDYFVFGHRHLPIDFRLSNESRYINLGDWVVYFTYGVFDGTEFILRSYTGMDDKIVRG